MSGRRVGVQLELPAVEAAPAILPCERDFTDRWFVWFVTVVQRLPEQRRNRQLPGLAGGVGLVLVANSYRKTKIG